MSGLAAGIRLAHFGKKVCIFERHNAPGGLNSFYSLGGRKYDVGLHAMTNYVPAGVSGTGDDNIVYDIDRDGHSDSGWGHPTCSDAATEIGNDLPDSHPIGG